MSVPCIRVKKKKAGRNRYRPTGFAPLLMRPFQFNGDGLLRFNVARTRQRKNKVSKRVKQSENMTLIKTFIGELKVDLYHKKKDF